jgi:glucose 1-dehydrogenase
VEAFGRVDVLMNNAGVDASGDEVADLATETFDKAIRTNLYGAFFCCRCYVRCARPAASRAARSSTSPRPPEHPERRRGGLRLLQGRPADAHPTLALELAPLHINVNSLGPGMVLTPFNQAAIDDPKLLDEQVQSIPWKRAAEPVEIARLAVFLASADSDYVTGATYFMDGGLMINVGQGA